MNASDAQTAPAVVPPSRLVAVIMGPMTRALNPVMRKLAGRRHVMMAAQIRHVGRRSGRQYVTPAGARLVGDTFVIPLTFGNQSDWSRNVRAAGGCSIRLDGTDYRAVQPRLADREQAGPVIRAAFGPVVRAMFRMLGIRQYLLLQRAESDG
jgi:deazaflavin-dependent oxidoreductase (nitroreductase family)